jgi:hypothetical protein
LGIYCDENVFDVNLFGFAEKETFTRGYNSRNYKLILFVKYRTSTNPRKNPLKIPEKKPENTVKNSLFIPCKNVENTPENHHQKSRV